MIPIKLEIQGLYSYKEKQTIAFDKLTAAGLFGIFGAVGSGKSAILEAILLALYGSTERLSDRGERNSMLNLQSDHLLLNFEFKAGKNNSETYMARYSAKRNSKNFEDIRPAEHIFYKLVDGNWEPTAIKADQLIGMRKDHFKQTVIIPQGKFREFIDQKPLDQAKMMKELFGLERFDLSFKTGILIKEVKEQKIRLETQLQGLEAYSNEGLADKKKEQSELQGSSKTAQQELEKAQVGLKALENLREKNQQLIKFKTELQNLNAQRDEIEKQRKLHSEYITAKTYIRPVWEQIKDTSADFEKHTINVNNCERFKVEFAKEIASLEEEEAELKRKNQERPAREAKVRDLKKVIEIQSLQHKLAHFQNTLDRLTPNVEAKKRTQKELEAKIEGLEQQGESILKADGSVLANLMGWKKDWGNLELQLRKTQSEVREVSQELEQLNAKKDQLFKSLPSNQSSFENWLEAQKILLQNLEQQRDLLMQKQGLSAHVHLLHQGDPCPLCGSIEHPNPLEGDTKGELDQKTTEIQKEKQTLDQIQKAISSHQDLKLNIDYQQRIFDSKNNELAGFKDNLHNIQAELEQNGIKSIQELSNQIEIITQNNLKHDQIIQEIKSLRVQWTETRAELENSENELKQSQLELQGITSGISTKKEEIKDTEFCKTYYHEPTSSIQDAIRKVEKDIENTFNELEGKQKHLKDRRSAADKNLADLSMFIQLRNENESKLSRLKAEFEELKAEWGFADDSYLIDLFQHAIDAERVSNEILEFDRQFAITTNRVEELEAEEGVLQFNEEEFQAYSTKCASIKTQFDEIQKQLHLLDKELVEISQKLEEKKQIQANFSKLEIRESYLKELENMFRGSGFVKFVSSIYLKELCNTANLRFMKLCKNRLRLDIDDNNTFWVIDYLNGGKKRLLKTLSGGQTFQASLCLALALAEKVKSLNQADQSFFFMDEGFGALDKNALRVVFETLKSLRHENRIVGIISHVEELQQEIGVFASIELDAEHGSQISYSY